MAGGAKRPIFARVHSDRRRAIAAVIASMVVVNLVYGLTLPLFSLVLDAQGISKTVIGTSILAQACAGVLLAPVMPALITRIGATRIMQRATIIAACTFVILGLYQDIYAWFVLRLLLGAAAAILWSASEAVINELADERWRGRIIGIYGSAGAAGYALGPLILIMTTSEGFLPFGVTAALIAAAGLPLLSLPVEPPAAVAGAGSHSKLPAIFALVPHVMLLNLVYAAAIEAFIAFFPLFGLHIGLTEALSLSLLTTFALGGVFLQLPLGWLADHMQRHALLLICLVMTMVGFAVLPQFVEKSLAGPVFVFALGGVEGMIYALGIILLGQTFRGPNLAAASVLYTSMWGVGMMLGPTVVGIGMDFLGDKALPYLIAAIYAAYLPVFIWRISKVERKVETGELRED